MQSTPPIPRSALVLGWLGVIPFVSLALLAWVGGVLPRGAAMNGLVLYGAIILSFMGGAHWGLAMPAAGNGTGVNAMRLAISVLPALAGFGLSFLEPVPALLGLSAAFVALIAYDVVTTRKGAAPAWYPALRFQLTGAVVSCLLVAAEFGTR